MLKPATDRLDYGNLLTPPAGYKTDFALGTTYSLDLAALTGIPVALFLSENIDSDLSENPLALLESLRRTTDKLVVLCEAGQILLPKRINKIFSLMDDSVFEVVLEQGTFHPKFWLIRYKNKDGQVMYRLIILSRNLTFDRSWDMAICIEGKKVAGYVDTGKNKPLQDFANYLYSFVKSTGKKARISRIIKELAHVQFEASQPGHLQGLDGQISDFCFWPIGINGYQDAPPQLLDKYTELVIISPFLSTTMVEEFDRKALANASKTLITRRSEIPKLSPEFLETFSVYALKEAIVDGEEAISEGTPEEQDYHKQDIHAKFYARSRYNRHSFFIGSANCSQSAFHQNVEFLIQIDYQKRGFRLDQILQDLFGEEEKENPFELIENIPVGKTEDSTIVDQLERAIKQLCRIKSQAMITKQGYQYQVRIQFDNIPQGADFSIDLLAGIRPQKLEGTTVIENIGLDQLGEFYKVTAALGGTEVCRVIKIKTVGIPEERVSAIYKNIIRDQKTFFQYISYFISEDALLAYFVEFNKNGMGCFSLGGSSAREAVLYEKMLKAAARNPDKIRDVEKIVEIIDDPAIIPEIFMDVYGKFVGAVRKAAK